MNNPTSIVFTSEILLVSFEAKEYFTSVDRSPAQGAGV
jgi:hypothetical protein